MDRIQFTESLDVCVDDEIKYFNQIMAMYDLVVNYENIKVNTVNGNNCISFELHFSSEEIANKMEKILRNNTITRFDKTYSVLTESKLNIVNVTLC